jgi:ferredoxin
VKVRVDAAVCVGHGRCYALAPQVFAPDDDGHAVVIAEDVPPELAEQARAGESNCPERAITLEV